MFTHEEISARLRADEHAAALLEALASDVRRVALGGAPTADDLAAAPVLDRYALGVVPQLCLVGSVEGHPLLGDRDDIHTSELWLLDERAGWVRTLSRFYRLGRPRGARSDG